MILTMLVTRVESTLVPTGAGLAARTIIQLPLKPFEAITLGQGGQVSRLHGQRFRGRPGDWGVQELLVLVAKLVTLLTSESLGHVRLMECAGAASVTM